MKHFNLLVDNIPLGPSEADIEQFIQAMAGPLEVLVKEGTDGERYCLVEAPTEKAYRQLLERNGAIWEGTVLEIRSPLYRRPVERILHAKRVPGDMTDDELRGIFEKYGAVDHLKVVRRIDHAFAFVTFRDALSRDHCLTAGQNARVGELPLYLQAVEQQPATPTLSETEFAHEMRELTRMVSADVNFKDLEVRLRTLQSVRQALFGDGVIGLCANRRSESELQELWTVKEARLQRAHQEFESDLISVEEDLDSLTDGDAPWEAFTRVAADLRNVENYLDSLGLPVDRERFFQKRIRRLHRRFGSKWLAKVAPVLYELQERFEVLNASHSAAAYDALFKQYRDLGDLRRDLVDFSAIFHHPPIRSLARVSTYQKLHSSHQQLWGQRQERQKLVLQVLRSEAARMVSGALDEFFRIMADADATLAERADALDEVEGLIGELRPRIPAEDFSRYQTSKAELRDTVRNARRSFLERVDTLLSDADGDYPDPEALLEEIKRLHRDQRSIPVRVDTAARTTAKLKLAWDRLSKKVDEKHRIASEHLSGQVSELRAVIDTENPEEIFRQLRYLSERVKRSRLSNRWKAVLENQLSGLYDAVAKRRDRDRKAAVQRVEAVEGAVESGLPMADVRDELRQARRELEELVLHRSLCEELMERLARVQEVFDDANEKVAQQLDSQIAACEELAHQQRFDRVFAEINRLQQEINRAGVTRRLFAFRARLNDLWQSAQRDQSESAGLLESLLVERIGACELLARDEPDFGEVHDALVEADRRFRERPPGIRLSQDAALYQDRIDAAFDELRRRRREAGDETREAMLAQAADIRKQLRDEVLLGGVFQNLQALTEYKRSHWKNQEDLQTLDALVNDLWSAAKRVAAERRTIAVDTARSAMQRSTLLASRWFDWPYVFEELKSTGRLLRSVPLGRDMRDKLLGHLDLQFDYVRQRKRADEGEEFSREWLIHRRAYCMERGMVSIINQRWSQGDLDRADLSERELFVLTHIYDVVPRFSLDSEGNAFNGVEYDEASLEWVKIRKYRLPAIWYQPFTSIVIEFPIAYPFTPPVGWYMDDNLNLRGWRDAAHYYPNRAFHGAQPRQGFAWYCCTVDHAGSAGGWHPSTLNNPRRRDNLWSFLDIVRTALSADD